MISVREANHTNQDWPCRLHGRILRAVQVAMQALIRWWEKLNNASRFQRGGPGHPVTAAALNHTV